MITLAPTAPRRSVPPVPPADRIVAAAASVCRVRIDELLSGSMIRDVASARVVASVCLRLLRRMSWQEIAGELGLSSHNSSRNHVHRHRITDEEYEAIAAVLRWAESGTIDRYYRPRDPETVALIERVKSRVAADRNINSEGGR